MSMKLVKWLLISALTHVLVIVLSTVLPLLIGLTFGSPKVRNYEVGLTEEIAEGSDIYQDEEQELNIDKNSLNIDVVPVPRIEDAFPPEIAYELDELIKIYREEIAKKNEINQRNQQEQLEKAKAGINVINTYPLGVHADVILKNLDFTEPFDAQLSFRVNSDGSFRAIEVTESSGMPVIDKSMENIFKELSVQKISFFTNFRRLIITMVSDGVDLTFTLKAFLKDNLNASIVYGLLKTGVETGKRNNSDDEETMTLLNNLKLKQQNNSIILTIDAEMLFIKKAIKD